MQREDGKREGRGQDEEILLGELREAMDEKNKVGLLLFGGDVGIQDKISECIFSTSSGQ
jgi:hypothetical protein